MLKQLAYAQTVSASFSFDAPFLKLTKIKYGLFKIDKIKFYIRCIKDFIGIKTVINLPLLNILQLALIV